MALKFLNILRTELEICDARRLWTPIVEQVRYGNRPNFKRPLPLHYNRKRMLAVCEPRYPQPLYPCLKVEKGARYPPKEKMLPKEENPFADFMARRMRNNFEKYPMIAIFHRNSYTQHQLLHLRGHMFDNKFDVHFDQWINLNVARKALAETKWAPVLPLLASQTVIGYCSSTNLEKFNKLMRKMPSLILLAVLAENKLMNRADAEAYSKIPDITTIRAQLCHTLNSASVSINRTLQANQLSLSHSLATYSTPPEDKSISDSIEKVESTDISTEPKK